MPIIRAGTVNEVHPESGDWVFVDLGFAQDGQKSCGLLEADHDPNIYTFGGLLDRLKVLVADGEVPLNLVLEAPLSVAFSSQGNPLGRLVEKHRDGRTRYWYVGLGCSVLTSATYLLRQLTDSPRTRDIRLFEGFVSFKPKGQNSDHCADVLALRQVVCNPSAANVFGPDQLASKAKQLRSAFAVAGMDYGIPPVLVTG